MSIWSRDTRDTSALEVRDSGVLSFIGETGATWAYDPESRIGDKGGFGEVFRGAGEDGQQVAVKRVPLRWGDEGERRRREREVDIARILAANPANHVMITMDVGRVADDLLLVMPLASRSLSSALNAGEFDQTARFDAVRQIMLGLIELAEMPVLHRDLKPANVLQVGDRWQLADFGIARSLIESTGTYTFRGFGTMPYMAPELWNGQPATIKSDLYALGVITYEVLDGRRPFNGADEAALRRRHQQEPPPSPTGVPAAVARLMLRLLAKNPAARPQDARAALEAFDAGQKRLTPKHDELRRVALNAERRQALSAAQRASKKAEEETEHGRHLQALSDLEHILQGGVDLIREVLPAASLRVGMGDDRLLEWGKYGVVINLWPPIPRSNLPSADPLVAAGAVSTAGSPNITANVVCERQADQFVWSLLRFRVSAFAGSKYKYGPADRPHGFVYRIFVQQRSHMLRPAVNVWNLHKVALTPEAVMDLLREAIESD